MISATHPGCNEFPVDVVAEIRPLMLREIWTLKALLAFTNREGECFPRVQTIARKASEIAGRSVCARTVRRALRELGEATFGLILSRRTGRANWWWIDIDRARLALKRSRTRRFFRGSVTSHRRHEARTDDPAASESKRDTRPDGRSSQSAKCQIRDRPHPYGANASMNSSENSAGTLRAKRGAPPEGLGPLSAAQQHVLERLTSAGVHPCAARRVVRRCDHERISDALRRFGELRFAPRSVTAWLIAAIERGFKPKPKRRRASGRWCPATTDPRRTYRAIREERELAEEIAADVGDGDLRTSQGLYASVADAIRHRGVAGFELDDLTPEGKADLIRRAGAWLHQRGASTLTVTLFARRCVVHAANLNRCDEAHRLREFIAQHQPQEISSADVTAAD